MAITQERELKNRESNHMLSPDCCNILCVLRCDLVAANLFLKSPYCFYYQLSKKAGGVCVCVCVFDV